MAGCRSDIKRWCDPWYKDQGGYGELQWTSVKGKTIYAFAHEVLQEGGNNTVPRSVQPRERHYLFGSSHSNVPGAMAH